MHLLSLSLLFRIYLVFLFFDTVLRLNLAERPPFLQQDPRSNTPKNLKKKIKKKKKNSSSSSSTLFYWKTAMSDDHAKTLEKEAGAQNPKLIHVMCWWRRGNWKYKLTCRPEDGGSFDRTVEMIRTLVFLLFFSFLFFFFVTASSERSCAPFFLSIQ